MNKDIVDKIEVEADRWIDLNGIFQMGERECKIATASYIAGRTKSIEEDKKKDERIRELTLENISLRGAISLALNELIETNNGNLCNLLKGLLEMPTQLI